MANVPDDVEHSRWLCIANALQSDARDGSVVTARNNRGGLLVSREKARALSITALLNAASSRSVGRVRAAFCHAEVVGRLRCGRELVR